MPPATTTSNSPALISCAASAIASRPDRHTLLIVSEGTVIGMPPATAACRDAYLARARLQHLAHDHVVDLVAGHARPLQRRLDHDAAQVRRGEVA